LGLPRVRLFAPAGPAPNHLVPEGKMRDVGVKAKKISKEIFKILQSLDCKIQEIVKS